MTEDHPCRPETAYGAAKLAGEAYARAYQRTYGLPTTVVRPFNNFGPRSHHEGDCGEVIPRFAVWALNGLPPVVFGDGEQTRDFLYVTDTAYWLRRIAECDDLIGATINLGSGKETSIRTLASLVCRAAGQGQLPLKMLPARPGDVRRHCACVAAVEKILGFQTRVDVPTGIAHLIEYLCGPGPGQLLAAARQGSQLASW